MLVAGANSACDVCLENFGFDGKAPCSISCGHVFCVDCLSRVERPQCPLCRNYFDPRATIRLHLDLDQVKGSPTSTAVVALSSDDADANRLREEIASIATTGCTESTVRKLLADGKAFLARVPKSSYKDLRTHHRLITYLCEVKTNLRSQKAAAEQYKTENDALEKEKAELELEKAALLKEIAKRKAQQADSLKLEVELREHCQKAHEAYTSMINQYNYVAAQWSKLNEEVKKLRMLPSADEAIIRSSPPSLELDHRRLTGAAVRKQDSILCTPLPEFTSKSLFLQPLPGTEEEDEEEDEDEDADDDEDEDDEESSEESDPEPSEKHITDHPAKYVPGTRVDPSDVHCTSASHPYSCKCSDTDDLNPRKLGDVAQPTRPAYVDHLKPALVQSNLSRSAPRSDVRRARSYSNPSTGSSSRGASTSRSVSRSPSPRVRSPVPNSFGSVYTSPLSQSSSRPADGEDLRNRLHSILSDGSSTSPPKPTAMASASAAARERESRAGRHRSPSPPRSTSPPQHSTHLRRHSSQMHRSQQSQSNTTEQFSKLLVSHQSPSPPLSTSPNARTSSASEAARALEQSKREQRQRVERDEWNRRSADREPSPADAESQQRVRARSSTQVLGAPSFHQKIMSAANTLDQQQRQSASTLQSRPSTTNFAASNGGKPAQHREYTQSNQPMSRYNTVSGKALSSSSMASLQQGTFAS